MSTGVTKSVATCAGPAVLSFERKLGRGTFGTVYLGEIVSLSSGFPEEAQPLAGTKVAVKKCPGVFEETSVEYSSELTEQNEDDNVLRFVGHKGFSAASCFREVTFLRMGQPCDYIVNLLFVGKLKSSVYMVLELMSGTLRDLIEEWGDERPTHEYHVDVVKTLVHDVASALKFLHERGILHRDIKPGNVLYTTDEDGLVQFKLADFGLARPRLRQAEMTAQDCMTSYFRSPEVIMYEDRYTTACDIWCLGVTILQLMRLSDIPWNKGTRQIEVTDSSSQDTLRAILRQVGRPSDDMVEKLFDAVDSPRRVALQEFLDSESTRLAEEDTDPERAIRREIWKFFEGNECEVRYRTSVEKCLQVDPMRRTTASSLVRVFS